MDLNKLIEQRMQKIMIMTKASTTKIVKKEFRKFKKDIIKELQRGKNGSYKKN